MIIVGDLNLNLLDLTNSATANFYDTILEDNYSPLIKTVTRSTNHSESIIDQILVHNKLLLNESLTKFSGNLFLDISDHFAQCLIIEQSSEIQCINNRGMRRNYSKSNIQKFNEVTSKIIFDKISKLLRLMKLFKTFKID